MIPRRPTRFALAALAVLLAATVAAPSSPEASDHRRIGADLEPLRSRFNQRADHVRAVLLVAPT